MALMEAEAKRTSAVRLTELSSCAGCAAKVGQSVLREMVRGIRPVRDERLLVGTETADDAGVYQIDERTALVQTIDFFTPIVDDPYDYGQIAATNALSDVYAMGGRPMTAMNVVGMPMDKITPEIMRDILRGGAAKVRKAECVIVGGHTIRAQEPIYGLSVTGRVHPEKILTNARARVDDLLVLTKPLGMGIATTGLKRNLSSDALMRKAAAAMKHLNRVGAVLAEEGVIIAATDVTGFGVMGHLASMCRASGVGAEVEVDRLPVLDGEIWELIRQGCIPGGTKTNLETAEGVALWRNVTSEMKVLLTDAQTSGGLMLCVPPGRWERTREILSEHRTLAAAVFGRITRGPKGKILVR